MGRDLERIRFAQEMGGFEDPAERAWSDREDAELAAEGRLVGAPKEAHEIDPREEPVPIVRGDSELIDHLVVTAGRLQIGLAQEVITFAEHAEAMFYNRWRLRMALLAVKS